MEAPEPVTSYPAGSHGRGMRQSLRVASFATAFAVFVVCTYFAFFRAHFVAPNAPRSGFFSAGWWLRPIEFNPAGRLHHVDPGVDFTLGRRRPGAPHPQRG